jgi:hypothetical protein
MENQDMMGQIANRSFQTMSESLKYILQDP